MGVFIGGCASAPACDWAYLSPQQAAQRSRAVFVGRVLSANSGARLFDPVSFVVEEPFQGILRGATIVVSPGVGDCANLFKTGERWLIFASAQGGALLNASKGSGSMALAEAPAALRWLRRHKDPNWKTQLLGVAWAVDSAIAGRPLKPLPNARVVLRGESGTFTATTDAEGVYEVGPVPAGTYLLSASFPGRRPYPETHEVRVGECCTFAEIGLSLDGHLRGSARSALGAPIAGERVELVPADPRWRQVPFRDVKTSASGAFLFEGIPPGEYLIGFGLMPGPNGRPRYAETYKTLSLGPNQEITGIELQVPQPLPERQIVIRTAIPGGRTAPGATIRFGADRGAYSRTEVRADERGEARITWVQDVGLTIVAEWQDLEHRRFFSSIWKTIAAKDVAPEITIELVPR